MDSQSYLLNVKTACHGVFLFSQGLHRDCRRLVCDLARHRHEEASRPAHLFWRCLRVHLTCVPPVSTQDSGEFGSESGACRYHGDGCLETLQVISDQSLDIAWPCAPVVSESVKVLPCNN